MLLLVVSPDSAVKTRFFFERFGGSRDGGGAQLRKEASLCSPIGPFFNLGSCPSLVLTVMGHRGLGWATHQTISTSEDEDGKMACGLTLIQEGLLDTGAVEAQTAGEGKGDLIARESSPFAGSYPVMSFLGFNNIVHPKGNQS